MKNINPFSPEDSQRIANMQASWRGYYGALPRPLKSRPARQPDDSVVVNRLRPICDKGTSFLFGQPIRFEVDETAPDGAQDYLDAFWKRNRQSSLLQRLALTGAVTGHAVLKLIPQAPYPRLIVVDPTILTVKHAVGDIEDIIEYAITYQVDTEVYERELITRDQSGLSWTISQQSGDGKTWATTNTTTWPHAWPPLAHCQNLPSPADVWGLSDIGADMIQLNVDLNTVLSNISRILRFWASPKTVGKGFTANQLNVSPDGMIILPSDSSSIEVLEMNGNLSDSLAFATEISRRMDELSRIPSIAMGMLSDVPKGQVSGLALQVLYQPALEKTETKRTLYGDMLVEECQHVLELAGFPADIDITIHWPSLLPSDDLQDAQAAQIYLALGASKDTLLSKLGFDPELEAAKTAQEAGMAVAPQPQVPSVPTDEETNGGYEDMSSPMATITANLSAA